MFTSSQIQVAMHDEQIESIATNLDVDMQHSYFAFGDGDGSAPAYESMGAGPTQQADVSVGDPIAFVNSYGVPERPGFRGIGMIARNEGGYDSIMACELCGLPTIVDRAYVVCGTCKKLLCATCRTGGHAAECARETKE